MIHSITIHEGRDFSRGYHSTMGRLGSHLLGLIGALVGGAFGFYTFGWLLHHGFYGLIIPGAFLGLGCGLVNSHASTVRGVLCALGAVALGLFSEWHYRPFDADTSLSYFLSNLASLTPVTLLMAGVGAVIAFWTGKDAGFGRVAASRAGSPPS
jgi:hypothetical protein